MAEEQRINVPELRRAVNAWLDGNARESRRSLSLKASGNRNPDVVRDLFRVDKRMPMYSTVADLAAAMGEDVSRFIMGASPAIVSGDHWLSVCGAVAAGVWREQSEWSRDDWFQIKIGPEAAEQGEIGLVVEGRSMDRTLPPGTTLRCIPLIGSGHDMVDGDYVIVERFMGGLRETTCKRLGRRPDGLWELRAESTLAEFQDPIVIGKPIEGGDGPGFDGITDDETRVTALVIDAYLPLSRRERRPFQ